MRDAVTTALTTEATGDEKIHLFASVKEGELYINLVNTDMNRDKQICLALPEKTVYVSGTVLKSADPHDCNTKEEPDRVRAEECRSPERVENGFAVRLEPASVRVLRFSIK